MEKTIKYRVGWKSHIPYAFEITRETEHTLWYIGVWGKEEREKKGGCFSGTWHDTFEESRKNSLRSVGIQIRAKERKLKTLKEAEDKLFKMTEAEIPKPMTVPHIPEGKLKL